MKPEKLFEDVRFSRIIDVDEIRELVGRYSLKNLTVIQLDFSETEFSHWKQVIIDRKNRRGEIALSVMNMQQQILLHTKAFYPDHVYRIPTGGLHYGESVLDGFQRELWEETGLTAHDFRLLDIIFYIFKHGNDTVPFVSYLIHISTVSTQITLHDNDEQITDFKWKPWPYLESISDTLRSLTDHWSEWGRLRAVPHECALQYYRHWQHKDGKSVRDAGSAMKIK
jgi:8-oxo-dGTP pyrophosphatase MutT (NUDIX family)